MKKILSFKEPTCVETLSSSLREGTQYRFEFSLIDSSVIGKPEEKSETFYGELLVGITIELNIDWRLDDKEMPKILFEYGKRHLVQKVKDGSISDKEELLLATSNSPDECPYDVAAIENPDGAKVEIEVGEEKIMENLSLRQLASSIIDRRDNINAIFHQEHKRKLIELLEERDLLQFFRDAQSQEEFSYRLCALRNAATNLNIGILRKITESTDKQAGSIALLDAYLIQYENYDSSIAETLKQINRIRQGYPVHGDRVDGVIEAHKHFGIEYPIENFGNAWKILLLNYWDTLERLYQIIAAKAKTI